MCDASRAREASDGPTVREEVIEAVRLRIGTLVGEQLANDGSMEPVLAQVLSRELDPRSAARRIIEAKLKNFR